MRYDLLAHGWSLDQVGGELSLVDATCIIFEQPPDRSAVWRAQAPEDHARSLVTHRLETIAVLLANQNAQEESDVVHRYDDLFSDPAPVVDDADMAAHLAEIDRLMGVSMKGGA